MLATVLDQGYWLDFESPEAPAGPHTFCGQHDIGGATCPNCDRPLLCYLRLRTDDPAVGWPTAEPEVLPLLFCWRCPVAQAPFAYRIGPAGVELLRFKKGQPTADFPYDDYPIAFPAAQARLVPISPADQEVLVALNNGASSRREPYHSLAIPRHQVGGNPYLLQPKMEAPACPTCGREALLLATFGDQCRDPRGFVDNPYVQTLFFYCPTDQVVTAEQACD